MRGPEVMLALVAVCIPILAILAKRERLDFAERLLARPGDAKAGMAQP